MKRYGHLILGFLGGLVLAANVAVAAVTFDDVATYTQGILAQGGVTLGSTGTALDDSYASAFTVDFTSIASNTLQESGAQTLTGAEIGDVCAAGMPSTIEAAIVVSCYVSAANAIKFRAQNLSAGAVDPASQSFRVRTFDP